MITQQLTSAPRVWALKSAGSILWDVNFLDAPDLATFSPNMKRSAATEAFPEEDECVIAVSSTVSMKGCNGSE